MLTLEKNLKRWIAKQNMLAQNAALPKFSIEPWGVNINFRIVNFVRLHSDDSKRRVYRNLPG